MKPVKFSVFTASISTVQNDDQSNQVKKEVLKKDSPSFFTSKHGNLSDRKIILTEEDLDAALTYLYSKTTKEVYEFVPKKIVEKEGIEDDGILFAKTRILEGQELRVMGELDETLDLESFTGVSFRVPWLRSTPL